MLPRFHRVIKKYSPEDRFIHNGLNSDQGRFCCHLISSNCASGFFEHGQICVRFPFHSQMCS
jgi:hypothetical protein